MRSRRIDAWEQLTDVVLDFLSRCDDPQRVAASRFVRALERSPMGLAAPFGATLTRSWTLHLAVKMLTRHRLRRRPRGSPKSTSRNALL